MANGKINSWHILIMGLWQEANEPVGLLKLFGEILGMPEANKVGTRVEIRPHDADFAKFAEKIRLLSSSYPKVYIYCYSWGGGHGTFGRKGLARELGKRGIDVELVIASDIVYHGWPGFRWIQWRIPHKKISVPANVKWIAPWFRQKQDYPRGHDLVAENPSATTIGMPTVLPRGHAFMDEAPKFWEAVLANIKGVSECDTNEE